MKKLDIDSVKNYLHSRSEILAAFVFGSYASDRATPESDIDIAVLLDESVSISDYSLLKQDFITSLIGLMSFDKVDVAVLNTAPPVLCHEVIKNGVMLFSKDEKTRIEFTAKATKRYLDTIHLRNVQDRILHEKIRSGNFGNFKGSHKYSIEKVRKGPSDTSAIK